MDHFATLAGSWTGHQRNNPLGEICDQTYKGQRHRAEDEFIRPADAAQSAGDLAWRDYGESSFSYSPTSAGGCFAHRYPAAACSKPNS
jgi:hypothetical protein